MVPSATSGRTCVSRWVRRATVVTGPTLGHRQPAATLLCPYPFGDPVTLRFSPHSLSLFASGILFPLPLCLPPSLWRQSIPLSLAWSRESLRGALYASFFLTPFSFTPPTTRACLMLHPPFLVRLPLFDSSTLLSFIFMKRVGFFFLLFISLYSMIFKWIKLKKVEEFLGFLLEVVWKFRGHIFRGFLKICAGAACALRAAFL